ncbi:spore germination lipoprotein GerD [Oceanobacillus senegalensis]|uniref:spore germination lipoprotein GerD n=1 Tax=Oceanobacillus senegalensis TaxID=1936063 RepID=UPI000A30C44E|nr:spore germination lipoprotein GerD [Oceanobacillus senegalensis]
MIRIAHVTIVGFCLLFLAACGGGGNTSGNEGDYDQTKKMVIDIIKTEEGKKALTDTLSDEKLKQELVMNSEVVKNTINETLVSDKGKKMWQKLFEDPKFVEGFAKSMEESQMELQKKLMSDSEYQKKMLELLQNPEITDQILSVLKGQQFRAHLEETIQQTLETPTFQAKIQEILLKAAEEQAKGKGGGGSEKGGGSGESGGGKQDEGGGGGGSA